MTPARRRTSAAAASVLFALPGCSGPASDGSVAAGPPPVERYVALGDSFTAAPYVPSTSLAEGCLRSDGNYPQLVAAALHARLRDVSCSGADTSAVTGEQSVAGGRGTVPSQLDAVRSDTDLVTVGIGGNDGNLFATLIGRCARHTDRAGSSCAGDLNPQDGAFRRVVARIGRDVAVVLARIHGAAPDARVVLVGYPRLVSAAGGCPAMPLATDDRRWLAGVERRLNEALRRAARRTGAEFVDMHPVSVGHEVCSDDPWVNGRRTDQTRALAFHPFARGQQVVADALLAQLAERP